MHDLDSTPLPTLRIMAAMATTLARHLDRDGDTDADKMWAEAHELQQVVKERDAFVNRFAPLDAIQDTLEFRGHMQEQHEAVMAGRA